MKRYTFAALVFFLLACLLCGFQCGSSDMTSAKLYIQHTDWDKAEAALQREVTKNPANSEAWYLLGQARMQRENYQGMMEAFDNSLKAGKEFEKNIGDSKKYVWGKSLNDGVTLYNKSVGASKDSAAMLRDRAVEKYKIALMINPDSAMTYQNLAFAYHANGKYEEEIATIKQGLAKKSTPEMRSALINAYLQRGQTAEEKGSKEAAAADYNNAIAEIVEARKSDPGNDELLRTMIDLYVRLNRSSEAKPYIYEAIARDPNNKVYQYNLGVLLMQTDSLKEAIGHFEKALDADPKYDVALQNIAVAHMELADSMKKQSSDPKKKPDKSYMEHFKKAAGYFERLSQLKPNDAAIWDFLGSAYANANMLKEAKEALKRADELRKK